MTYHIEDETIEAEDTWDCDFQPEEGDQVEQVPALKKLELDGHLCTGVVHIVKAEDGRFFAIWEERHPEMVSYDEFFPHDWCGGFAKRTASRAKQWEKLEHRMPSKHYAEEISRHDAYATVAWFCLPEEFHADAGV